MAILPTPGGSTGIWGTLLNDFLGIAHNSDGTLRNVALLSGGTGASFATAIALAQGLNLALWRQANDISAAATITLPNPLEGNLLKITGNTGISALSTAGVNVGTVLTLQFTGTPTLTHGASFSLQGGVNYTCVGGEIFSFEFLTGSIWKEISRNVPSAGTPTTTFWRGDGTWQAPVSVAVPGGGIVGLTLANNAGDAVNDIDVAAGSTVSDDADPTSKTSMYRSSSLTKQLDVNWAVGTNQGGLDTGAIGNNTYHVFLIKRTDTGVVDALFSLSATAPTMPANYTKKQRIGSITRVAGAIVAFVQDGDRFRLTAGSGTLDVDTATSSTVAVTITLSVPTGIRSIALIHCFAGSTNASLITPLDEPDLAPSDTAWPLAHTAGNASATHSQLEVMVNTSAQCRRRSAINGAIRIATRGWIDFSRGRN